MTHDSTRSFDRSRDFSHAVVPSIAVLIALLVLIAEPVRAQVGNAGQLLRSGREDANLLLRQYFEPVGRGFGPGLNTGWVTGAETHGVLGFDVRVNASLAAVPTADQSFLVSELSSQLNTIEYLEGPPVSQTVAGADRTGSTVGATYTNPRTGQTERLFEFEMPPGSGFSYVPVPMIQGSVGVPMDTDVSLRLLPSITIQEDLNLNLFGVGARHELNQWLPGGGALPVTISVQTGYTSLDASVAFTVEPDPDPNVENPFPASTWEGQEARINSSGFTMNALVGTNLPFVGVFGGLGWETSTVDVSTPGSYPVVTPNPNYDPTDPESDPKIVQRIDDPVALSYDGANSFRAVVGAEANLLLLNVSASYTIAEYPVIRGSIGFSLR